MTALLEQQESAAALRRSPKDAAPYPWVDPPPNAVSFCSRGSIAAPAFGSANQAVVTSFTCPRNFRGVLKYILNVYTGSGFDEGSGSITWVIDVNVPLSTGGVTPIGYGLNDYQSIVTTLGSLINGPWPVPGGVIFQDGDVLRYKVTTAAPVAVGAPNFVHCMLLGWIWPISV